MNETRDRSVRTRFTRALLIVGVAGVTASGCEVTNPGPIQDEFLAQPASQQGLVNGGVRLLAELLTYGSYTHAILARELFPGGQTGFMGHDPITQSGHILPGSFSNRWNDGVQARFITETAISRFTEVGAPDNMLYQAYLWNAFTYRTMGEWWCDSVLGPTDPDDTTPGSYEQGSSGNFELPSPASPPLRGSRDPGETHAARGGRARRTRLAVGELAEARRSRPATVRTLRLLGSTKTTSSAVQRTAIFAANARRRLDRIP